MQGGWTLGEEDKQWRLSRGADRATVAENTQDPFVLCSVSKNTQTVPWAAHCKFCVLGCLG